MVELSARKTEMRGYGWNHHETMGIKRISCDSQLTIPDMAGTSPDRACNYTHKRLLQPNQASRTWDFSYPLVSSTSFFSSSPISVFLVHNSIIAEHKGKLSLSISPFPDHVLAPSIAYPEYSIHQVQHTPSTASRHDCLSSLHSPDDKLTSECSFSFRRASPWELTDKVPLSHSHGCKLTIWWKESQHPEHCPSTASQYSSKLARLRPASASPISHDKGLQIHLQTHSIVAYKCVSKVARSWPPIASPNSLDHCLQVHLQTPLITGSKCICKLAQLQYPSSHDHGLQVHLHTCLITASKCISKLAQSRPPSTSPKSLNHGIQLHLETHSTAASKYISKVARSRPPGVSPNSPNYSIAVHTIMASKCIYTLVWSLLQVHLRSCSITALDCISEFIRSSFSGTPRIALKHHLQPVQIYCIYMGSYI